MNSTFQLFFLFFFSLLIPFNASAFVQYKYSIRKNGINHHYGLKVSRNGDLHYYHSIEKGTPDETKLPPDRKFAKSVFETLKNTDRSTNHVPCGVLRGAKLIISEYGNSNQIHDLINLNELKKYGTIARLFERRLQPLNPIPIQRDCLALGAPVAVKILKNPVEFNPWFKSTPSHSPKEHFIKLLNSTDEEETITQLTKISTTIGSDPFFAKYLVKNFRISSESREMVKYHGAFLTFNVSSAREATYLIKIFKRGHSLEKKYFLTLLYLLKYDFEKASDNIRIYFSGIGRPSEGKKESNEILKIREAIGQLNYGKTTWNRQILTIGFLFDFWYKWAQRISATSDPFFPLSKLFYFRAFHYARMFAGNLRVGSIPATPRGRKALTILLPLIAKDPWWVLPAMIQHDLMEGITAFRAMPKFYGGKSKVKSLIPSIKKRIYELSKMERFRAVNVLISKNRSVEKSSLNLEKGKAIFENELWERATQTLKETQDQGDLAIQMYTVAMLNINGTIPTEAPGEKGEAIGRLTWLMGQSLFEKGKILIKYLSKKKLSKKEQFIFAKFKLGLGDYSAFNQLTTISKGNDDISREARFILAEFSLISMVPWKNTYRLIKKDLYSSQSAKAWAFLAISALRNKNKNADIFIEKAIDTALSHPIQQIDLLELMIRYGVYPGKSWILSQEAFSINQNSSKLFWLRSVLLFRSKLFDESYKEISKALAILPYCKKYIKIKKLIKIFQKK